MKAFTVFVLLCAVFSVASAWHRPPPTAQQWRVNDLKARLLAQLQAQMRARQQVLIVQQAQPQACGARPLQMCQQFSRQFCGFTSRFGRCRDVYVQMCTNPQPIAEAACVQEIGRRCAGAQGDAFTTCTRVCGNTCRMQAQCVQVQPEPEPAAPADPKFCVAPGWQQCQGLSFQVCGVTSRFGTCREAFAKFCSVVEVHGDCHEAAKAKCQNCPDQERFNVCYNAIKPLCERRMGCGAAPEPEPEPVAPVNENCVARDAGTCGRLAVQACGLTSSFGVCRDVFNRLCTAPAPVAANLCDITTRARCGAVTGNPFQVCYNANMRVCNNQAVCVPVVPVPVPPAPPATVPAAPVNQDCLPRDKATCDQIAVDRCGVTSRFGRCREIISKFCQEPEPTEAGACARLVFDRCGVTSRFGRCREIHALQCAEQAACRVAGDDDADDRDGDDDADDRDGDDDADDRDGDDDADDRDGDDDGDDDDRAAPEDCLPGTQKDCEDMARDRCGVTSRFGRCREIVTRFCMAPQPCPADECEKQKWARCGLTSRFGRCREIHLQQCLEQAKCLEREVPRDTVAPVPTENPLPVNCRAKNADECMREARDECGVTNNFGVCREVFVGACQNPQAQTNCNDWSKIACMIADKDWKRERCEQKTRPLCERQAECGEPEETPEFVPRHCRAAEEKPCRDLSWKVCGATNKLGVCRDVFVAQCRNPTPRADCEAFARMQCNPAAERWLYDRCVKVNKETCQRMDDCGEAEQPTGEPIPETCMERPRFKCEEIARQRNICSVTNRYGVCREVFIAACQKPTIRAEGCAKFSADACAREGRQDSFERCQTRVMAQCEEIHAACAPATTAVITTAPAQPTLPVQTAQPTVPVATDPAPPATTVIPEDEVPTEVAIPTTTQGPEPTTEAPEIVDEEIVDEILDPTTAAPTATPDAWEPKDFWDCWTYCAGRDGGRDIMIEECGVPFPGEQLTHATTTAAAEETTTAAAEETTTAAAEETTTAAAEETTTAAAEETTTAAAEETTVAATTAAPEDTPAPVPEIDTPCPEGMKEIAVYIYREKYRRQSGENCGVEGDDNEVCWNEDMNIDCLVMGADGEAVVIETPRPTRCMRRFNRNKIQVVKFCVGEDEPEPEETTTTEAVVTTTEEQTTAAAVVETPDEPCPEGMRQIAMYEYDGDEYVRDSGEDCGVEGDDEEMCWDHSKGIDCVVLAAGEQAVVLETPGMTRCVKKFDNNGIVNAKLCVAEEAAQETTEPAETPEPEPAPGITGCETAFAKSDDGTCFLDMEEQFNRWGWSNALSTAEDHTLPIYAAAGQCDTDKGTLVGQLTVSFANGRATVTYDLNDGYHMTETHVHIGAEKLPKTGMKFTVAPGQYGLKHGALQKVGTDRFTADVEGLDEVFVVAHAVVCKGDPEEPAPIE